MPNIKTLIPDICKVLEADPKFSQWKAESSELTAEQIEQILNKRLVPKGPATPRKPRLYMSNIGTECKRRLWYHMNSGSSIVQPSPSQLLNFMYGDMLEVIILEVVKAAGHKVEGQQDRAELYGLGGYQDAIIDGVVVDVKTASPKSFHKFKTGELKYNDPFGYRVQLASYLKAAQDDPRVKDKNGAAFLVINKANGDLWLDYHDLRPVMDHLEEHYTEVKELVKDPEPPHRLYSDVEDGKSGNRKLVDDCVWCPYKKECWPGLRKFNYKVPGPKYLTQVVFEPRVEEDEEF